MSRKLLITSLICTLPFAISCSDEVEREEANFGQEKETQVIEAEEDQTARVIDREAQTTQITPATVQEREVERGSKDVEYTTQRQVTETLLKQEQIPTIQICRTKADINRMDAQDFIAVGFNKQEADLIVRQRQQSGQFQSVQDLNSIQGVSQQTVSSVQNDLGVGQRQAQEATGQQEQGAQQQEH